MTKDTTVRTPEEHAAVWSFCQAIDADIPGTAGTDDALDILMNGGSLNGTLELLLAPLFKRVEDGVNRPELLGDWLNCTLR